MHPHSTTHASQVRRSVRLLRLLTRAAADPLSAIPPEQAADYALRAYGRAYGRTTPE